MSSRPTSADDLYGLPLEEFTTARGELAKALRKEGQREEAKEIAALRKPSVAAWAVNQLVRTQKRQLDALLKAGDALQQTQSDLLSGNADRDQLAAAVATERDAVDALTEKARGLLSGAGEELSPVMVERVAATLHAAALDEEARTRVSDGRLDRELEHVGLGGGGLAATALGGGGAGPRKSRSSGQGAKSKKGAKGKKGAKVEPQPDRSEELAQARQRARDAGRAVREADKELGKLERRRDQAAAARDDAHQKLESAEEHLRDAEQALVAQREQVEQARAEAQAAEQAVKKLS